MQSSALGVLKTGPAGATGATGPSVATVTGTVDFGSRTSTGGEGDMATTTLTYSGVTAMSHIDCIVCSRMATIDHDPDDIFVEGLYAYATARRAGDSFDCVVVAPAGTWGQYNVAAFIMAA